MQSASWKRILLPALVTFAAGILVGRSLPESTDHVILEELPLDLRGYSESMIEALALDANQADDLRILLFQYERERGRLLEQQLEKVDSDWVSLDERFESLLAGRILRPDQRKAAAELQRALTVAPRPSSR